MSHQETDITVNVENSVNPTGPVENNDSFSQGKLR